MNDFETLGYDVKNHVATITLNRPKAMNSFNKTMRLELSDAIVRADADEAVRVVIIAAAGRGFCAGADLQDGLGAHDNIESQILLEYKPFLMAIAQSDKIYISAVQGAAAGIGAALALTCDFCMMADNAFIYLAFAAIGLVPDGGASYHLIRALGYKRALQLVVEAGRLQANQCLEYGLINKVVAADSLQESAQTWAEALVKGAPLAQKFSKQILRQAMDEELGQIIDLEAKTQITTITSEDYTNAVEAFFNKETPVFVGK